MGDDVTILLNNRCDDLRSIAGSEYWYEEPLPYGSGDLFDEWYPAPSSTGTFYQTSIRTKCGRVVIAEGAVHDGSTYTTLGTLSVWLIRKTTPSATLDRPEWKRGEGDVARWSGWYVDAELDKRGWPVVGGQNAWFNGGSVSFDLTTSGARQRVFDALIQPQRNGQGTTLGADISVGDRLIRISGSDATSRHNSSGFTVSPKMRIRIGTDPTIYTINTPSWSPTWLNWWSYITPAPQVAASAGTTITYLRGIPMQPNIPHDILFRCTVYKYVKMSKVREVIPDSDPVQYMWQAGSKTFITQANAGARIRPSLFYWPCEPRSHYAAP